MPCCQLPLKQVRKELWILTDDMTFTIGCSQFVINKGTHTDLATVPKWARWLVPKRGKWDRAAILHDKHWRGGARKIANMMMVEIMKQDDVSLWHRFWINLAIELNRYRRMIFK